MDKDRHWVGVNVPGDSEESSRPTWMRNRSWIVRTLKIDGLYYVLRWVGCGKKGCKKCPHGPYWYCNFQRSQKKISVYLGSEFKTLAQRNEELKKRRADREALRRPPEGAEENEG